MQKVRGKKINSRYKGQSLLKLKLIEPHDLKLKLSERKVKNLNDWLSE